MKPTLCIVLLSLTISRASGQGLITWGNDDPGLFRAPIYGLEDVVGLRGQSPLGIPTGSTFYQAPLLRGTGYTFSLWAGPATAPEPSWLTLVATTSFRTGTGGPQALPKGLVNSSTISIPGVRPGERMKFVVRAWDNAGGVLTFQDATLRESSEMVLSAPLGGVDSLGNTHPTPFTDGWTSFSFWIPEPSSWLLASLFGSLCFAWRRRRR